MADLLQKVGTIISPNIGDTKTPKLNEGTDTPSFAETLKNTLNETNEEQVGAQNAMADMATGEVKDLHQAAIAITKAELSMKLMLEVRNKAISAYKEISRTQL